MQSYALADLNAAKQSSQRYQMEWIHSAVFHAAIDLQSILC